MKHPFFLDHLSDSETENLLRHSRIVEMRLAKSGLSSKAIQRRIQTELWDPYKRKSLACPYEVLRAQKWCLDRLPTAFDKPHECHLVTLGRPQDRVPVGELHLFNPDNLFRKFNSGISELRALGCSELTAFAVLEIHLVEPGSEPSYYEPHLHIIIQGPSAEQIKKALKVRKPKGLTFRKRPLHVKPITNLEGAIGYCTKLHPKMQVLYCVYGSNPPTKRYSWFHNHMRAKQLPEWYRCLSRFDPGEFMIFVGIDGRELSRPLTCELSLKRSEFQRRRL